MKFHPVINGVVVYPGFISLKEATEYSSYFEDRGYTVDVVAIKK